MLTALSTGHDGSLCTIHAGSPAEALRRVETLALMAGLGLPHAALREQVADAFDLVVCQARAAPTARAGSSPSPRSSASPEAPPPARSTPGARPRPTGEPRSPTASPPAWPRRRARRAARGRDPRATLPHVARRA